MEQAQQGDRVRVHYTGALTDGTVFDSTTERNPFEFTIGKGQIIPGFEEAVVGMKPGETKKARIPPEKAYGRRRPEMIVTVERRKLGRHAKPEMGQDVRIPMGNNRALVGEVKAVTEANVTVDANHLLAGETLVFEIRLVEIA